MTAQMETMTKSMKSSTPELTFTEGAYALKRRRVDGAWVRGVGPRHVASGSGSRKKEGVDDACS